MAGRDTLLDTLRLLAGLDEAFGPDGACPVAVEEGRQDLVVVTGENAGGKSYLAKHLGASMRGPEVISVSMRMRTQGGMGRALMYGDEDWETTGQNSVKAVLGAIDTINARTGPNVLVLDEPDVGLGESYQAALGDLLASVAVDTPPHTKGIVVVSHSRPLVSRLVALGPTLVRVGDDLRPTREWLADGDRPKTVEDLEGLLARANARFRKVTAMERSLRDAKADAPRSGRARP